MASDFDKLSPAILGVINVNLRKGDLRKVEIIKSAIDCLATLGVEQTTFEEIGRKIGIRKSHVAYHFPNMDDLIETAIRYVLANVQNYVVAHVKNETGWRRALEVQARCTIGWPRVFPNDARVYLFFCYRCSYNARLRELNREFREVGIRRIVGLLEPVAKKSKVGADRLQDVARRAQEIVFGALLTALTWESPDKIDELIESTLKGEFAIIESALGAARRK
jgi:AcrR family transcriptional regulator